MAEIERNAYESVNVITPLKLTTSFLSEEKICKRCPKRAQYTYTVTHFFEQVISYFRLEIHFYIFLLLS